MAVKEINDSGGIFGHPLELIALDDRGKAEEAVIASEKLISQHQVVALIGEVASTRSIAMAPIAQHYKIPMISPYSINSKVTQHGDFIFRACFVDRFQTEAMAKVARTYLRAKKVGILSDVKSDYSRDLADQFATFFKREGGEIVIQQSYSGGDIDFKSQLTAIRAMQPDLLFVPAYYTEAGLIMRQAKELGLKSPLFGGGGWDSPILREIAKEAADGAYILTQFSRDYSSPVAQKFLSKYKTLYGQEPSDGIIALGYDTTLLIADALKRALKSSKLNSQEKNLSAVVLPADLSVALRDALASTVDFLGVTGQLAMDSERNPRKSVTLFQFNSGGRFKRLATVSPDFRIQ
jgi:branched-chain amino acid transport system substrate-binding protein